MRCLIACRLLVRVSACVIVASIAPALIFANQPAPAAPATPPTPAKPTSPAPLPAPGGTPAPSPKPTPKPPSTPAPTPAPAAPAKIDTAPMDTAVVQVIVKTDLGNGTIQTSNGTGVYLGSGRVLTASHVISRYTTIEIIFGGRSGQPQTSVAFDPRVGKLVSFPSRDVSVLTKINAPSWAASASIATASPKVGDQAVSYGLKDPATPRIRQGAVLASRQMKNGIEVDAVSTKGDSGGPTFDSQLRVMGVHSANVTRTYKRPDGKQEEKTTSVSFNVVGLDVSTLK
ncbi:MAG: serine protease [Phycisphaerales bacterium]|nr:serine protease [Phycisphaerales bacterium]